MLLSWLKVFLFFERLRRLEQTSVQTRYATSASVANDRLWPQNTVVKIIRSHPVAMHMYVRGLVFLLLWQVGLSNIATGVNFLLFVLVFSRFHSWYWKETLAISRVVPDNS